MNNLMNNLMNDLMINLMTNLMIILMIHLMINFMIIKPNLVSCDDIIPFTLPRLCAGRVYGGPIRSP